METYNIHYKNDFLYEIPSDIKTSFSAVILSVFAAIVSRETSFLLVYEISMDSIIGIL